MLVRGCEFKENKPQVLLGPDVRRAIVSENILTGAPRIANQMTKPGSPSSATTSPTRRNLPARMTRPNRPGRTGRPGGRPAPGHYFTLTSRKISPAMAPTVLPSVAMRRAILP